MSYYSDGQKVIEGGIVVGGIPPVWVTQEGSLGTVYTSQRSSYTFPTLTASNAITYTVTVGSLPAGMSLNTNGTFSGTPSAVSQDTISTFTVSAVSAQAISSERQFSITIKAPVANTFNYTGSDQTFTVPGDVSIVEMYLWGAAGGGGHGEGYSDKGGPGGAAIISSCTVTPGDVLKVQVGQGGWNSGGTNGPLGTSRAYPWGGRPSPRNNYNTGYGGGRSAVFKSNTQSSANCLAVAGGGGGSGGLGWSGTLGGKSFCGGPGGGTNGQPGHFLNVTTAGLDSNTAGTQSSIGSSGLGVNGAGVEAAQFKGGDAANPEGTYSGHGGNTQGGGGDGWYGGRASSYAHSGGGGGSGYINPTYATGTLYSSSTGHTNSADSPADPPQTGNAYYGSSAGRAVENGTGNNGRVVIVY